MSRSTQQTQEWWKESLDDSERRARLASFRASQHGDRSAAWRRNMVRIGILIAIPVLIRVFSTMAG